MAGAGRVASVQAGGGRWLETIDGSVADRYAAVLDQALEDRALVPVAVVKVDLVAMLGRSLGEDAIAQSHATPVVGLQLLLIHVSVSFCVTGILTVGCKQLCSKLNTCMD